MPHAEDICATSVGGNYPGIAVYVVTFVTNNTSNPNIVASQGVTVTREGVGSFKVLFDETPTDIFAVVPTTMITSSGTEGLHWNNVGGDLSFIELEYHTIDGTEADTTGKLCSVVIFAGHKGSPTVATAAISDFIGG